jgi:hypothetical protein
MAPAMISKTLSTKSISSSTTSPVEKDSLEMRVQWYVRDHLDAFVVLES